jgi:hypothetical protein
MLRHDFRAMSNEKNREHGFEAFALSRFQGREYTTIISALLPGTFMELLATYRPIQESEWRRSARVIVY